VGWNDEMRRCSMDLRAFGLGIALAACLVNAPAAQSADSANFPSRAVKIVVPFPPGGPTDVNIRIIAQRMSADWRQPVVVENRPGANTVIAAQAVARAEPDGYTLLAAMDSTLVMNPAAATAPLGYDPFNDFAAITLTAKNTSLLTVRARDGPRNVAELIGRARAKPGGLTYGAGIVITRLAGYLFGRLAAIDLQYIPYKGSSEVVQGLMSGSVDFIVDGAAPSLPLIASGDLRALAKLNSRPLPQLPDLAPLSVAAGLPALDDMSSWIGLVAPAGTPRPVIGKINREVADVYADRTIVERLDRAGINPVTSTPEEFDAFFRSEAVRWTRVFRDSGIRFD
jgi:tripartite-type tricarboxylate transporter receptor subunit TctC